MSASQHEVSTLQGTLETLPGDIFGPHNWEGAVIGINTEAAIAAKIPQCTR